MQPEENQTPKAAEPTPAQPVNPYERRSAKAGQAVIADFTPEDKKPTPKTPHVPQAKPVKLPKIPKKPKPKKVRNWTALKIILNIILLAAIGIGFWQRQNIIDWYTLRNYQPPVAIVELANDSYMNANGRKIFYLNKPAVQQKVEFYQTCSEGEIVILGCYKPRDGIYLLEVDDKRLYGVEQVTAAHEMLHAAYARLSFSEKQKIDAELDSVYKNSTDKALKDKIKLYTDSNADITNELHSILGTEVVQLTPELEAYYQKYFYNRKAVVALSDKFQSEFTRRRQRVDTLDKQLSNIEQQVKSNNTKLKQLEGPIIAEEARLNSLLSANKIAEYNQAVTEYNQSLVPYNNLLAETKALINQYKTILTERNKIAAEAQELNKSLDSSITTDSKKIQ